LCGLCARRHFTGDSRERAFAGCNRTRSLLTGAAKANSPPAACQHERSQGESSPELASLRLRTVVPAAATAATGNHEDSLVWQFDSHDPAAVCCSGSIITAILIRPRDRRHRFPFPANTRQLCRFAPHPETPRRTVKLRQNADSPDTAQVARGSGFNARSECLPPHDSEFRSPAGF
jgi:hypothetical protein